MTIGISKERLEEDLYMRYISEERLRGLLASFNNNFGDIVEAERCLLDYLLEFECTELKPVANN